MQYTFRNQTYITNRYPKSANKTLRAWSAAEEYILRYIAENEVVLQGGQLAVYNDRFGFLSQFLSAFSPQIIIDKKSQEQAIISNFLDNKISLRKEQCIPILQAKEQVVFAIVRVPKSLEMWRLYLYEIAKYSQGNVQVVAAFMTKYFSPQIIKIAEEFFGKVEQGRAWKKSRVLILGDKKPFEEKDILHHISFQGKTYQQYWGVFSSGHIDYATQFLIDHLQVEKEEKNILDLASGNGILATVAYEQNPEATVHLVDDSYLAIASSRLNLPQKNVQHHWNYHLKDMSSHFFDLVISNPPFHFGQEIDISIPLGLFQQVAHCLKPQGRFILVANRHLNYKTQLVKWFSEVVILAENQKFVVYQCVKPIF